MFSTRKLCTIISFPVTNALNQISRRSKAFVLCFFFLLWFTVTLLTSFFQINYMNDYSQKSYTILAVTQQSITGH